MQVVVQADLNRIDKVFPRVFPCKLSVSFLIFIDAAVALLVRIGNLVFTLVGDPA